MGRSRASAPWLMASDMCFSCRLSRTEPASQPFLRAMCNDRYSMIGHERMTMRASLKGIALVMTMGMAVVIAPAAYAVTRGEAEETARLIGTLLSAGRVVIERNQSLIDDRSKGNKGFTPAVFEQQLTDEFRLRSGIDVNNMKDVGIPATAKALLRALVESSKSVVADAQDVINRQGVGYKNFIPA